MADSPVHSEMKHLRRKSWVSFVIMVGSVAWATSSAWSNYNTKAELERTVSSYEQRLGDQGARFYERLDAFKARIQAQDRTIAIQQMQTHALHTLLRKEQASAGDYEAKYIKYYDSFKSQRGSHGYWKRTANYRLKRICHLEQLARDNGVKLYTDPECKK